MFNFSVNYLAVFVAGLIPLLIGRIWYGSLFGKLWMKHKNVTPKKLEKMKQKSMVKMYAISTLGHIVTAYVFAVIIVSSENHTALFGLQLGFILWLGFVVPSMLGGVLWEEKSLAVYNLDVGCYLVCLLGMGAILGAW